MKIINTIEEKMFERVALTISLESKGTTPSREDLQKKVADLQKVDAKLVVINEIKTITGSTNVVVTAQVYKDAKSYKLHVPSYLKKKSEVKEEVKEEAAPAEEAPQEEKTEAAPKDEATEEVKEESTEEEKNE